MKIDDLIDAITNIKAVAPPPRRVRLSPAEFETILQEMPPPSAWPSASSTFWGVPVEVSDPLMIAIVGRFEDWE